MYDKGLVDGADRVGDEEGVGDASITVEWARAARVTAAHTGNLAMLTWNGVLLMNTCLVRDLVLKGDLSPEAFQRRMERH